jgi:hypothetical protein
VLRDRILAATNLDDEVDAVAEYPHPEMKIATPVVFASVMFTPSATGTSFSGRCRSSQLSGLCPSSARAMARIEPA